ncbi:MAG TPA: type I-B CRISPR-associated protein Cas5 [bacterium]|mgnify:CR=1 FL=1|nr:type I-B CRISPR-associated protein Cas5 [bacterium]
MRILVFDLFAPYGHFRVPYTTTSPLTLPVPSKTALYGIFGAILGLDKSDYLNYFQDGACKLSISIRKPLKKTQISENLINTAKVQMFAIMDSRKEAPHTQIRYELLKDSEYRIYVHMNDDKLFNSLEQCLSLHRSAYSISFGLSELLANYSFIGSFDADLVENIDDFTEFSSIIPLDKISSSGALSLIGDGNKKYIRFHMTLEMKPDREIAKTGDFISEVSGEKIKAKISKYHAVDTLNENIVLF